MQTVSTVPSIMHDFAISTGLTEPADESRRYLWTDAFAVCNFIELYRQTSEERYLHTARRLVDEVHFVLGRYSKSDSRSGWISGLDEQAGYRHPTVGGLRIGKKLPERTPDELFDSDLEWDRDGQYFHYLTKWMHALTRMAAVTGQVDYQHWALELARVAHASFTYNTGVGQPKQMYWKMSVDLSRPLIASMGHHDPLEGLVTCLEIQANSKRYDDFSGDILLAREINDCLAMSAGKVWATDDSLGTGNLLVDTFRLAQMKVEFDIAEPVSLARLLVDCEAGLEAFSGSGMLNRPAGSRLAFRELGLSTGLHALARLQDLVDRHPGRFALAEKDKEQLQKLNRFDFLADLIEQFWLQPAHQQVGSWREHLDINSVMLATSLAPDGYLLILHGGTGLVLATVE